MNLIKLVFVVIFVTVFFTACIPHHKITLDINKKDDYNILVNSIYANMKQCFQSSKKEDVFGIYPLKESYTKPPYSKVTLYAKFADTNMDDRIGVITVFKREDNHHRVVITGRGNLLHDWYFTNKMECDK